MVETTCPNCEGDVRKTGAATPGNTPEKECESCWWNNTPYVPGLPPKHQGKDLSRSEARNL